MVWRFIVLLIAIANAAYNVKIDTLANRTSISPLIYGINFADAAHIDAGRHTLTRWGGNAVTRYNYVNDMTNSGSDYFFENHAGCWNEADNYCQNPPTDPKTTSGSNQFLQNASAWNVSVFLTIPIIGYVAKDPPRYSQPLECGCWVNVSTNTASDPYNSLCGNGQNPNNKWTAICNWQQTSQKVTETWSKQWATYIVQRFGPSHGNRIYQLDNEPNLWPFTHYDVHPNLTTYDELWSKMQANAVALLQADPTAEISGPAEWGWTNYFCSIADSQTMGYCSPNGPDRQAHGGLELVAWLLQQAKNYEKAHGKRILHFLDLHYYPQGGSNPERTRSLWDQSYLDPSWINDNIRLLPRMRDWVNNYYPGTKLAISEFDFYDHTTMNGALALGEVLGLFGRYGVDAATHWSPPSVTDLAYSAYKIYRNYDGNGSSFESTSVFTNITGTDTKFQAFSAIGPRGLTIVIVNENTGSTTVNFVINNFIANNTNANYYYATGTGSTVAKGSSISLTTNSTQKQTTFTFNVPASTLGIIIAEGSDMGASVNKPNGDIIAGQPVVYTMALIVFSYLLTKI